MNIRAAAENDLPAILDIYNHAVLNTTATAAYEPQSLDERRAWLHEHAAQNLPILVAENSGSDVIGWASLSWFNTRYGYRFTVENSLYVSPDAQGQGVGKALLSALIDEAKQRGLHTILASISSDNAASLSLHEKFQFQRVAHLKELVYKFDTWLDVIYLQLMLPSP